MTPRHKADYRTLLWLSLMMGGVALHFTHPTLGPLLFPLSAYLAISAGVIAHNHNHCPLFSNRWLNGAFGNLLSIFYGYPIFAWVPTHNQNHHKFVNRPGDDTITWRYTNRNNWWVAVTYFFVSAYWQSRPIREYIRKAKQHNRRLYRSIVLQFVVWATGHATMLGLASWLWGFGRGVQVWVWSLGLPALVSLWTIMLFNYVQHVHADPWSEYNHSRNFTGRVLNFVLFNNGYHTAHHARPAAHWSTLPALHATIEPLIHPELKQTSFWGWILRSYLLSLVFPSLGTQQIGRAPHQPPPDGPARVGVVSVPRLQRGPAETA
jgi:beta-carotene hydroxylase